MIKLWSHQQRIIDQNPKKHLLAHEVGTGKTITAITLAKKNNQKALVICPKSIKQQWLEQVPDDWLVLHKEGFKKMWNAKSISHYNCLIIDECHFFASPKSQLTKSLLSYIARYNPEYIYLLTGTPYTSSSWSIYTYGLILGKNWRWIDWNRKFFDQIKMGRLKIPVQKKKINGVPTEEVIASVVKSLGSTVKMEETLGDMAMPEQIFQTEYFELTKEQREAIASLTDLVPITLWTKTHELCGATLKGDGYTPDKFFKSQKLDRVLELAKVHPKLVIVCRYNLEIHRLEAELKAYKVIVINGETKDVYRATQEAEQSDRCIVLVQASVSSGYELPTFPLMIFYSLDFSLVNYLQVLGRISRRNRLKRNVYLSLVIPKTIDEDVWKCMQRKEEFNISIYQ
jgi:superfamily II DNA or RNA helicase